MPGHGDTQCVRDPQRLPQDLSLWPQSAVELVRAVPQRDLLLLRSPDPGLRAIRAVDESCSEAAMCLLVGDVEPVRAALGRNRRLCRRARDMLLASAMAEDPGAPACTPALKSLMDNPAPERCISYIYPKRADYPALASPLLKDPSCSAELLRVLWRVPEVKSDVARHPNLPDDLVLRAATIPEDSGGSQIRGAIRQRQWAAATLDWDQVRTYAAGLAAAEFEGLFSVLPDRLVSQAALDSDPGMRLAAVNVARVSDTLKRLASDPVPHVRAEAHNRLLRLLTGLGSSAPGGAA